MSKKKIMSESEIDSRQEESVKAQISLELEKAKDFARGLDFDEVTSGRWFTRLLTKVVEAYDRNARAQYFQQKYPGLPSDEIADILTSVVVRCATIAGAIAGAAATVDQIAVLSTAGMTTPLFVGTIGAEMIYLARIQMRLVLDLSVVYDLQLDPEDPEDVLMVFGYALGVAPADMVGRGLRIATGAGVKGAVKKYISKGTLKAIQDFARRLGFKILQRTIIKYAVPLASAAVGSGYNYVTTRSVGRIARAHFKNRGKVTDELRALVSRQNTYDLAFPAAVMYMAQVDEEFSPKERELYRAMLSRMSFDEHTQAEFQRLLASEESILEVMAQIEDVEVRQSLIEVLVLMAVYDGELAEQEREFLLDAAERLGVLVDISEVEQRASDYQVIVRKNILERTAGVAGGVVVTTVGVAGQTAGKVKDSVTEASGKVKGGLGKLLRRAKGAGEGEKRAAIVESPTVVCANCGEEVLARYAFCPSCGQPTAAEKVCPSCGEVIPVSFAFCPHCGAAQVSTTAAA